MDVFSGASRPLVWCEWDTEMSEKSHTFDMEEETDKNGQDKNWWHFTVPATRKHEDTKARGQRAETESRVTKKKWKLKFPTYAWEWDAQWDIHYSATNKPTRGERAFAYIADVETNATMGLKKEDEGSQSMPLSIIKENRGMLAKKCSGPTTRSWQPSRPCPREELAKIQSSSEPTEFLVHFMEWPW